MKEPKSKKKEDISIKKLVLLEVVAVGLGSFANLLFKVGVADFGSAFGLALICFGIALYGLSTLIYFFVLSKSDLSWAYSFVGLSYIFVILLSGFIGEAVTFQKIIGGTLITLGVVLVSSNFSGGTEKEEKKI